MNNISYVKESEWKNKTKSSTFSNLNSRHLVLMEKIKEFYSNSKNLDTLVSVINGDSLLSLRIIDFFVTNYARENEIIYDVMNKEKPEKFMVYYSYKSQLKAFSKKQFDPFCRRERILFFIDKYDGIENDPLRTTVGQLNFFKWAIKNNVLRYIHENYDTIEREMNKTSKKSVKKYKTKNDMTLSATRKINKHNITITVKFN
jgi:hypothetical protein